jgi:signal transduction histidine kinase
MLLVTLVVIASSVFLFILQNEQQTWQGRQGEAARHAAETVTTFIQRMGDTLTLVSLLDRHTLSEAPEITGNFLHQNPALLEIVRLDVAGQTFASAYQDEPLLANSITIPQSRWFIEAKKGQLHLGTFQISPAGQPYLIISIPAPDGGVVAARLRMNVLWDVVSTLRFGETGQAYVINQEAYIVAYIDPEVVLSKTNLAHRPEVINILKAPHQKWSGSYVNFRGVSVVGVTTPVSGTRWVVITEVAEAEAFAVSRTAVLMLGGGMFLFGGLVMLVTGRFLGRLILQPMERLRAGAKAIGDGNLDRYIEITQQDEIGQVAAEFNEMAHRLQEQQAELILARDEALEASRLKTQLLSNVSHDLRTPLNAILGYTEMLQEGVYGEISPDQHGATTEIIDSTTQLLSFVNNLLDQARIDAGRVAIKIVPFAPADLLREVQAMLNVAAQTKGLQLVGEIGPEVPPQLFGDPHWLRQILVNLASNALKFTERGRVCIRIDRPDTDHWALIVSDTGPGIPAEAQSYIFEAFRKVEETVTSEHSGAGLGLSIVQKLTLLMGGHVTLESELGEGSTFRVILPLKPGGGL